MRTITSILLTLMVGTMLAQGSYTMDGTLKGLPSKKIFLLSYYGEKTTPVDSAFTDSLGRFRFVFSSKRIPGQYRIQWGPNGSLDMIWNRENISFNTDSQSPEDSLKVISSIENQIYHNYLKLERIGQAKLELLMSIVDFYPVKDSFYQLTTREFENTQMGLRNTLDSLAGLYPTSFAVRIFKVGQSPYIPASLNREERLKFMRQHFLDKVDFTDTALLYSNAFANKAFSYLAFYSNPRMTQKQLEPEFIKMVTVILSAASVNAVVYKFLLDYLVGGFDKFHFDEVITYIAENFQDPFACEDQSRKTALQKKLDTFKKIAVGKIAPDIEVKDDKARLQKLSGIQSEYTLLIFWSTECSHCLDMMPRVKALYDAQKVKRFEVMAVSIDTSFNAWTSFIKKEKLNWINVSDLKGFSSKAADDYNIYATPTMFLLDRGKKILSKPISYRELEQALKEQKLVL